MALPPSFQTYNDYFEEAVLFLKEHDFFFNYANTEILSKNILNNLPEDWIQYVTKLNDQQINLLVTGKLSEMGPLSKFFDKKNQLSPVIQCFEPKYELNSLTNDIGKYHKILGVSPKKHHEIVQLSALIDEKMRSKNVSLAVDLGSGLGYLSQLLHTKYGHEVLGIEADSSHFNNCIKRQAKNHKSTQQFVKYINHYVTISSAEFINNSIIDFFGKNKRFYLVGLHACADLTINAIKLFLKMELCEGIIIMPCCYHKMSLYSDNNSKDNSLMDRNISSSYNSNTSEPYREVCINKFSTAEVNQDLVNKTAHSDDLCAQCMGFINFPLSESLKRVFLQYEARKFLQRPFLRLGCQRTLKGWNEIKSSDNEIRLNNLVIRAVLEMYSKQENLKIVKCKRSGVKSSQYTRSDFSNYLDAVANQIIFKKYAKSSSIDICKSCGCSICDNTRKLNDSSNLLEQESKYDAEDDAVVILDKDKVLGIWNSLEEKDFVLAKLVTFLQDTLQDLCENVILLDKLAFLHEQNMCQNYLYLKITNTAISPRCYALLAEKQ